MTDLVVPQVSDRWAEPEGDPWASPWHRPDGRRVGSQRPRLYTEPAGAADLRTSGPEVAALAVDLGLPLYPWQSWLLGEATRWLADDTWAARDVAVVMPRQNGKTAVLALRMLAGILLLDERLILYSAHLGVTTKETLALLEDGILNRSLASHPDHLPALADRIDAVGGFRVTHSNAYEMIKFGNGARIRFLSRMPNMGRGLSPDLVILDEASFRIPPTVTEALIPAMSARPNPQTWYASSSGDHSSGTLLRLRASAAAEAEDLLYAEWSAPQPFDKVSGVNAPERIEPGVLEDTPEMLEAAYASNPLLGFRLTERGVRAERRALTGDGFGRERLGIWGDAPSEDIPLDGAAWKRANQGPAMALECRTALAIDVSRSRASVALVAVGPSALHADRVGVLLLDLSRNTSDAAGRIAHEAAPRDPATGRRPQVGDEGSAAVPVVVPAYGPAAPFVHKLRALGIEVVEMPGGQAPGACAGFADHLTAGDLDHAGQDELDEAVTDSRRRWTADGWIFDRKWPQTDLTPLWAAAAGVWHLDALDAEDDSDALGADNTGVS